MNISCHSFVPTYRSVSSSGNKRAFFDYWFISNSKVNVFPISGNEYTCYLDSSSTNFVIVSPNSIPLLPRVVYDRTEPKADIFLLY